MSACRKRSAELKALRARGVPIDGDYRVPARWLASRRRAERLEELGVDLDVSDVDSRDEVRIDPADFPKLREVA